MYTDRFLFTEHLQVEMLRLFELPEDLECRLWQRYMTNSYELLNKPEQTLSDASLYGGQVSLSHATREYVWFNPTL